MLMRRTRTAPIERGPVSNWPIAGAATLVVAGIGWFERTGNRIAEIDCTVWRILLAKIARPAVLRPFAARSGLCYKTAPNFQPGAAPMRIGGSCSRQSLRSSYAADD